MSKSNVVRSDVFAEPPHRAWRGGALVLAIVLFSACDAPGRAQTAPARTPALNSTPAPPEVAIAPDGRISFEDALAYADAHAPEILVARGQLALGDAEVRAARQVQPYNPTLSVGLGQRRQAGGSGLEAEVAVEQQVEIAGQRRKRREAARRMRELTELGLDAASWEVHAEAHRAFQRALLAEEGVGLAQRLAVFDEELLAMARRRVEVGDESPLIVDVATAQVAMAHNARTAARAEAETSRLDLAMVIGWEGPTPLQPAGTLEPARETDERRALVRRAYDSSPRLRQAEARTQHALASADAARREAWPSPTVGLRYAREGSTSTPGNPNPASDVWMGTLALPIPAFARNQGSIARSRAQVVAAEARTRALKVQFAPMVDRAATRVDAAAQRVHTLERKVVPVFEKSLSALTRAYEIGDLDYLEVAQARTRLAELRLGVLDAKASYFDALADLERLVGPLAATEHDTTEAER